MARLPLTDQEQKVYKFITEYIDSHDYSPTYRNIQEHFEYKSVKAVQDFVRNLKNKGYLEPNSASWRGILPTKQQLIEALRIPLAGMVAAGFPIEAVEANEYIEIPKSMVKRGAPSFALKVKGDSMVEDNISDGDYVIIQKQKHANNGEIVVAIIDNSATLKRFYQKNDIIELHPANKNYRPIRVKDSSHFEILGVLTGVIRQY